ncbi:hypothetical protein pb186bvf_017631 [Paramecium bursaria]
MIVEEILDGIEGFGEYANMYQEIFNVIDNLVLKYQPEQYFQIERENAQNLELYKKAHNTIIKSKKRKILNQYEEEKSLQKSLGPIKNKLEQFLNIMPYYQTEQLILKLVKNNQVYKIENGLECLAAQKQEIVRLRQVHKEMMEELKHIKHLLDFYAMIFQIKIYENEEQEYLLKIGTLSTKQPFI